MLVSTLDMGKKLKLEVRKALDDVPKNNTLLCHETAIVGVEYLQTHERAPY